MAGAATLSRSLFGRPASVGGGKQPLATTARRGMGAAPRVLSDADLEARKKLLSPIWTHLTELVVDKAEGSWITGTNGQRFLDFSCGIAVTNLGHCHPKVVRAVQEQAGRLFHGQANIVFHKPMLELADRLQRDVKVTAKDSYFFSNSGAEAIEASVKLARHATGKPNIITFEGSFHGRTVGTMSLTNSKTVYRAGYGPLMSGVAVTPYAYCHHCPCPPPASAGASLATSGTAVSIDRAACCGEPLEKLRQVLKQVSAPDETAAVLLEPVLGEGGYVVPPRSFLQGVRKICSENNMLMIVDEIQSGVGRTGTMFAYEQFGVQPDILVFAKGIANGLPLSGIVAHEDHMSKWRPGSHGGTYGGNAVACAAAVATLDAIRDERVLDNVRARSAQLFARLATTKKRFAPHIADVRGLGLMVGIELNRALPYGTAGLISKALVKREMLLLTTSSYEAFRLIPPLTVSAEEIDIGVNRLEEALDEILSKQPKH